MSEPTLIQEQRAILRRLHQTGCRSQGMPHGTHHVSGL